MSRLEDICDERNDKVVIFEDVVSGSWMDANSRSYFRSVAVSMRDCEKWAVKERTFAASYNGPRFYPRFDLLV